MPGQELQSYIVSVAYGIVYRRGICAIGTALLSSYLRQVHDSLNLLVIELLYQHDLETVTWEWKERRKVSKMKWKLRPG